MAARGPGEPPPVVRRRARRVKRKAQTQQARAQQNQYVSQGKAVQKAARQQRTQQAARQVARGTQPARPLAQRPVRPQVVRAPKPLAKTKRPPRVQRVQRTTDVPRDIREAQDRPFRDLRQRATALSTVRALTDKPVRPRTALIASPDMKIVRHLDLGETRRKRATVVAPALKILDQTTRPIHAISAGQVRDIKAHGGGLKGVVGSLTDVQSPTSREAAARRGALKRGAQLKDRSLGSDVLKAAGVKNKAVAGAAGFVLDVAQDPTTYVTAGAGSVAARAGAKAARRVERKAARAGIAPEAAKRRGATAARRAEQKAPQGSGVTVSFAGREVPGVRRATAAVARTAAKPMRKVAPAVAERAGTSTRNFARNFAPRVRQGGTTEAEFRAARAAARSSRARVTTRTQRAMTLASKLQRDLDPKDYAAVIDAIERNDLSRLPTKELAQHAHMLRSQLKGARRASRRAGVAAGSNVGDVSRALGKQDLKRLDKSVAAEQRAQKRRVSRAVSLEQGTRERALVTEAVGSRTGRRAGQAALRYERRAATTHLNTQQLKAAQNIPKRAKGEADKAWLERVVKHAKTHDLPIVRQRAQKLLDQIPTDVARGYFPREYDERILKKFGVTPREAQAQGVRRAGTPTRVVPTTQGFTRREQRRLATVNEELRAAGAPTHSENIPLVVLNHMREAARATSQGEFAKALAKAGRPIKAGDEVRPGEAVYKLGYRGNQFGLHEVQNVPKRATKGGQYVALNKALKDGMQGSAVPAQARDEVLHVWDKATGTFKRVATATIGFHVRNMIGDIGASYLETPGHRIVPNIRAAAKATARESEHARRVVPSRTEATVKVAGRHEPIDEFLKGARENGVLDAGYIGRELHDLGAEASGQLKVRSSKGVRGAIRRRGVQVDRWMTNRENLMRLATYKAALDKGMTKAEAADVANMIHVDYGELSEFERKVMRRVFPFYTWTARSLPVQAKYLVTHPGKFATIEKAREETAAAFGMNEEAGRRGMTEATQRQLPFVVKIGHGPAGISASIPTTLLNELPTGASPRDLNAWLDEVGRFGIQMVSPMIRGPFELRANRVFYTRQDIENERRPLTAAPSWVQFLPSWAKRDLHVTPAFVDKRTGKKTWGWRGKADWWSRQIPGAPQQVSQLASGGRPGQPKDTGAAIAGGLGIRVDSLNAQAVKRTKDVQVFKKLAKLNQRAAELNQQGITSDNATPEYKSLRKQINALTRQVRPSKRKKSGGGSLFDQPSGGGGGGGGSLFDSGSSSGGSGSLFDG